MSDTTSKPDTGDRLAKVIARSGLCSRRDAEVWITEGRVVVNGKKVLTPAFNVTGRDKILVDGAPLAARQGTRVWLYHKPAGLVVTEKDPEGRETIFEHLESHGLPRVVTVGRLDINTEGLLLLTNDGGLKRVLELPATGWLRRYRVRAHGTVTQAALDKLKDGIEIDGIKYGSIDAQLEREQGANVWLVLALREGKNREVKNVLGALGLEVNRLIRVSYGPFQLGDIPVGGVETVKAKMLRDQLGKKLAEAADVDFDSEMPEQAALVGKPTRDRLTGRGTNTVEIARQRFRFTDHAEKTEEEWRAERPRQDRPGRSDGRKPMARREERRDDEDMAPPRRIHFDEDGRAPEEFVAKRNTRLVQRPDRDDQPARSFGKAAPRPVGGKPAGGKKPFGDKKPFEKKAFGDKPRGPRRDDDRRPAGARPDFSDRPRGGRPEGGSRPPQGREFTGTPRGPRRGDPPAGERSAFTPRLRPDSEKGEGAAFRGEAKRPGRNFGDKPARGRPAAGERPARSERPARPGRDEFGSESKTYGKPRTRADGKPVPKRDGAAPARGPRPGGFGGKPGGRPGAGGRPGGAGRPSGGPRKPRG
ncbi:MAG TPA: pseudouridine synthase [Devosia sp.]|jgi:23S rRNA pseudouridine2605 synthase|uniref:pseudouridine synthase n=1 Tax=Devosia sp. TaxID=1871048 RepID=UPI002F93E359